MPVFVIAQVDVLDDEKYAAYGAAAPSLEPYGAEIIAYDMSPTVIEGEFKRQRVGLVRFPSREKFQEWYDSPEYTAARAHRQSGGANGDLILVQGF